MSLSELMAMEDEMAGLRDQLSRIVLAVPDTFSAFDGDIPTYVKSAFDAHAEEISRLQAENQHLRSQASFLREELMKFVNISPELRLGKS